MSIDAAQVVSLLEAQYRRDPDEGEEQYQRRWRALRKRLVAEVSQTDLSESLLLAPTPRMREAICNLIGDMRAPAAIDSLLRALHDSDSGVRGAAADALGKIFGYVNDPPLVRRDDVLTALAAAWSSEASIDARSTFAQTFALLGDQSIRPLLEDALDDPDPRVRGQARWGLEYLNKREDGSG
jgi:HEAT repeat protein